MKHTHYSYCIFYLESKYYKSINDDLKDRGYKHVKAIVPTVRILKGNTSRGDRVYKEEPVLFNYGFIKMPTVKAMSRDFLRKLKRDIPGIRGFLKNTETLFQRKKKARIDNMDIFDDFSIVATCPRKDVRRFIKISQENKRFSVDDLVSIKPGDYVILRGYPFEGVDATVLEVDQNHKKCKLLLYPQNGKMEIWLPFDSVLYSIYQNYDPHKLYVDQTGCDLNQITQERVDKVLNLKQI
jgi:transcription antitermination factor NusG